MQLTINNGYITDMSANSANWVRKLVYLDIEMWEDIEDFRFRNRIKTEVETIRRLIEQGFRRTETPAVEKDVIRRPAPPGPFPWEKSNVEESRKAMNVDLPARLKLQLDWLVSQRAAESKPVTLKVLVAAVLKDYVDGELRTRGLDPG